MAAVVLLLSCVACQTAPPSADIQSKATKNQPPISGCLDHFGLDDLDDVLSQCDATVQAHPNEPAPLSDRAFVLSLKGNVQQACADVERGLQFIRHNSNGPHRAANDPMLHHELKVRQAVCKQQRTIDGND